MRNGTFLDKEIDQLKHALNAWPACSFFGVSPTAFAAEKRHPAEISTAELYSVFFFSSLALKNSTPAALRRFSKKGRLKEDSRTIFDYLEDDPAPNGLELTSPREVVFSHLHKYHSSFSPSTKREVPQHVRHLQHPLPKEYKTAEGESILEFLRSLTCYMELFERFALHYCCLTKTTPADGAAFSIETAKAPTFSAIWGNVQSSASVTDNEWQTSLENAEILAVEELNHFWDILKDKYLELKPFSDSNNGEVKRFTVIDEIEDAARAHIEWIKTGWQKDTWQLSREGSLLLPHLKGRREFPEEGASREYINALCRVSMFFYSWLHRFFEERARLHKPLNIKLLNTESIAGNGDGFIVPQGLPQDLKTLRDVFLSNRVILLTGGGGSGKSTYLQRIQSLSAEPKYFRWIGFIPLRFLSLIRDVPFAETLRNEKNSLIWRWLKNIIQSRSEYEALKKDFFTNRKGNTFLFLLDGYNEILNNKELLSRIRGEITWLAKNSNTRILLSLRAEGEETISDLAGRFSWIGELVGSERFSVLTVQYDLEARAKKALRSLRNLSPKTRTRLLPLLQRCPMYLLALESSRDLCSATQYAILHALYNTRYASQNVFDESGRRWTLWNILLPEIAYRMATEGVLAQSWVWLGHQVQSILQRNNENLLGECLNQAEANAYREELHYPFGASSHDVQWVMDNILLCDGIIYTGIGNSISFFHEDIQNYLAVRHVAQRLRFYQRYPEVAGCYLLPVKLETLNRQTFSLFYEAVNSLLSENSSKQDRSVVAILQAGILPKFRAPLMVYDLLPGKLMQARIAAQLQEYDKEHRQEITPLFSQIAGSLANACAKAGNREQLLLIPPEGRECLCRVLFRASQLERLDGEHPVPPVASMYAELAAMLAEGVPNPLESTSLKKIAWHYQAKALLFQAQYIWKHCPENDRQGEELFVKGCSLLKRCAQSDSDGAGYNLSSNLLALWYSAPAPFLIEKAAFHNEIGVIDPAAAFRLFFCSVLLSPQNSVHRPYAASKCIFMLLEQQVMLNAMDKPIRRFSELENAMENESFVLNTSGRHFSFSSQEVRTNIQAARVLLQAILPYMQKSPEYLLQLLTLYKTAQKRQLLSAEEMLQKAKELHTQLKKAMCKTASTDTTLPKLELCRRFVDCYWIRGGDNALWQTAVESFKKTWPANDLTDSGKLDVTHPQYVREACQHLLSIFEKQICLEQSRTDEAKTDLHTL